MRGWLAGFFDAEGHVPTGSPYFTNKNRDLLERGQSYAGTLNYDSDIWTKPDGSIHRLVVGGHPAKFLSYIGIQNSSKQQAVLSRGLNGQRVEVVSVEAGPELFLYDLTTETHNFIANGLVSHNCWWCDSGFAVLPADLKKNARLLTADEILEEVCSLPGKPDWVTLSGGNPALLNLERLVDLLHELHFQVAIETQGSQWKDWLAKVDVLTVSPKPPSSGMKNLRLANFLQKAKEAGAAPNLKIPVLDERDLAFARDIHLKYREIDFYLSVVTRMGGLYGDWDGGAQDTTDDLAARYRWLVESATPDPAFGDVGILPQLHVVAFGHARGR
jgi:7-carboxy-7-deazaguanine synthase